MTTASDMFENINNSVTESSDSTYFKFINFKYKWTILNFTFSFNNLKKLESPEFPKVNTSGFKARLNIYPNNKERKGLVKISAEFGNEVKAKCKLSILNFKGQEIKCERFEIPVKTELSELNSHFLIVDGEILNYTKSADDMLTILCEVTIPIEVENIQEKCEIPECRLLAELSTLFGNKKYSDVTLCSGDQEFPAHKALLAARSTVFSDMFDPIVGAEQQNEVPLTDVDPDALKEMLRFIYTGEASNIKGIATELLAAAKKFKLDRLKAICEEEISKTKPIENSAEAFKHGDMVNNIQLKLKSLEKNSTDNLFYRNSIGKFNNKP